MDVRTCTLRRRRRADGTRPWQGVVTFVAADGRRRQRSRTFGDDVRTRTQAVAALQAFREEVEGELEAASPARVPVPEYARRYVAGRTDLAPTTRDGYAYSAKHIDRPQLRVPIGELKARDVRSWLYAMEEEGVGQAVRAHAFKLLRLVCRDAWLMELISENPCDRITRQTGRPSPPRADPNPLDARGVARLNALLDNMGHTMFADASRVALMTGMREGEVCAIRWRDVEGWEDGSWRSVCVAGTIMRSSAGTWRKPYPKNEMPRRVHVNSAIAAVLDARAAQSGVEPDDYVFGDGNGGFWSPQYLGKLWRQFAESNALSGVKGRRCTFHDLRHTYATHALASGIDVVTVAAILGHKDRSVTLNVYAEFLPDRTEEAQRRMDDVLGERERLAPVYRLDRRAI